jgi:hypothetical protein
MRDAQVYKIRRTTETVVSLRADARECGFAYLENALDDELLATLRAEASAQSVGAFSAIKGDSSPYKAHLADLGDEARSFLRSPPIVQLLQAVLEEPYALSEHASCYTYYESGDFLGLHRDRPVECAATVIVYLDVASPDPQSAQTGLSLRIFGEHGAQTTGPRAVIPTRSGTLVVGRGSRSWHERPPLQAGERVVALTACFAVHTPSLPRHFPHPSEEDKVSTYISF